MSNMTGKKYAEFVQRQFDVSGKVSDVQSGTKNSDSGASQLPDAKQEYDGKQKENILSLKVIIEETGTNGDEHYYKLSFYDDLDLSLSPYSRRSKKAGQQVLNIPGKKSRRKVEIPMVLRIHKERYTTFSHSSQLPVQQGIALFYGELMVQIERAVRRILLIPEEKEDVQLNERKQPESTPTSKSVRAGKSKKWGKEIRVEIQPETQAEVATGMANNDRTLLGNGSGDWEVPF